MRVLRIASWRRGPGTVAVALMLVWLVGCGDDQVTNSSGDDVVDESQLEFVPRREEAPPLETTDTSFYAVRGEDRELEIRFAGQGGPGTGKRFLELDIESSTLLRRPDGTAFAEGDSIEIRVTIDTVLFLVEFEPSGLEFDPTDPAELEIEYDEAEEEFLVREGEFDVWRQERPGDPWERIGSLRREDLDEIEVQLVGFTRYALAVGR